MTELKANELLVNSLFSRSPPADGAVVRFDRRQHARFRKRKEMDMLKFFNPLWWLEGLTSILHEFFGPILRALGLMKSPPPIPHDNAQIEDVRDAARLAEQQQAAVEALQAKMSAAEVVRAYARATEDTRKAMDLVALSEEQQDWLLRLSDVDLIFLGNESVAGCERSLNALQVFRFKARRQAQEPERSPILSTSCMTEEEKRAFIKARYAELYLPDGSANPEPKYRG
ncbi:hypothetical protein N2601_08765 [Rhizobium sp. CB3060]|uniref:hypothetical protein n=1 Tax=Rhizobium sp. CB3060 TaxID=3138255 RepID=UPI0021A2D9AD|nr:hypothetical protein [Rhizobium tropici]UWU23021.1 hypothetical protein N2601_08765 [Rhizobium tropici]